MTSQRLVGCLALAVMLASFAFGQNPSQSFEVSGTVLDPSGASIAEAKVILRRNDGGWQQSKTTNRQGEFRFTRLASGNYEIDVQREGFKPTITSLSIGAQSPPALQIALPMAELSEEVSVVDQLNRVNTNPDDNLNVIKLDRAALKNLPVLGNDVIGTAARLLDAGSLGSGGPTVIVDGLESKKRKAPASQIQEVRINQNPYSAEFFRLGRGRIEVITKAGSSQYHGEFNLVFRDHRLDARNTFAQQRPPEQRRIFEGNLNGPLGNGKTTSFLFGVQREEEDLQSIVFARTPAGIVAENVANPNRDTEVAFRVNHRIGEKTTFSVRYEFTFDSTRNGGVGGFNLPEVASNSNGRDQELYFTHHRILSPKLVNELTLWA